jgi:all-trans-retinol dehydrogenase (NAD+)
VKARAYKADVSDYEAIKNLKQVMEIDFPGKSVDILINNAGILSLISLREGNYQQIQKVIDVNFTSHFWVTMKLAFLTNDLMNVQL